MPRRVKGCVFCQILSGESPAEVVTEWFDAIAIKPPNPVTEGHLLVVPRDHIADATEDPELAGIVMQWAAVLANKPCNLITSAGPEATQTIDHLHIHIVPRREGDGLCLPWTQKDVNSAK